MAPPTNSHVNLNALFLNTHLFGERLPVVNAFIKLSGGGKLKYKEKTRARKIANHIIKLSRGSQKLDMVGLCEIWDDDMANLLHQKLTPHFPFWYRPEMRDLEDDLLGSGLAVFSKYKFSDERFRYYTKEAGHDNISQKGILQIVVNVQDRAKVVFLTSHLQAGSAREERVARDKQIDQIRRTLIAIRRKFAGMPIIMCGDFNIKAENDEGRATAEYKNALRALSFKDAYRVLHPDAAFYPGYTSDADVNRLNRLFDNNSQGKHRIDFMLYEPGDNIAPMKYSTERFRAEAPINGDGSDVGYLIRHLSDHYGIYAQFKINA